MKKRFNKKAILIIGSVLLVTGLIAIPAFAATSDEGASNFFGKMQSFMASGKHQEIMNSPVMQDLHNSEAMQEVMRTGDIAKMQEAMNSNPEVKALLGEETLNQMNQFMQENGQAMSQMMNGQTAEVMNQMMSQGVGMHTGSGMMGSVSVR